MSTTTARVSFGRPTIVRPTSRRNIPAVGGLSIDGSKSPAPYMNE